MKRLIIGIALFFAANSLFAQFSVHLSYSEATKEGIGAGYDFSKRFWSDVTLSRWVGDDIVLNFLTGDISVKYNCVATNYCDLYVGAGTVFPISSSESYSAVPLPSALVTTPAGLRLRPFEKADKVAFQIEIVPAFSDHAVYVFGKLGIHYSF